jgi:hypothetical protein
VLVVEGVDLNRVEAGRRVTADEVHDIGASLHGVLTIARVDLPSGGAVAGSAGDNAGIVQLFKVLDSASLLEVLGDVASVGLGTKRSVRERARDVNAGHGHAGRKLHNLVQTFVESVSRTNDGQVLVVLGIGRQDDGTASLGKEVVERSASVTNDELVTTTLDSDLVRDELTSELFNLTFELGTGFVGSQAVTGNLDGQAGLGHESRRLTVCGGLSRSLLDPSVVVRDLDSQVTTALEVADTRVMGTSKEGVELCGDVLQAEVDGRGALVDNLLNLLTGHFGSNGISLDENVDGSRVIIVEAVGIFLTRNLDLSTSLLTEIGDVGTTTTNDVSTDGERYGDLDALLLAVSDRGNLTMGGSDLLWNQAGEQLPSESRERRWE